MLKKLNYIFDKKQKTQIMELMILILIGTALETIGVTAIVPFISAIMYPNKIMNNKYAKVLCDLFHLQNVTQIIIALAIMLIVVYIMKNTFLMFMYDVQFRFVYNNQRKLSTRLMNCYMSQPYAFHLKHNSGELIQNTTQDVEMFFSTVLQVISVVTDVCVCTALAVILFITDKSITIGVSALLIVFILVFYKKFQSNTVKLSNQRRNNAQKMMQSLQQGLGGIKELKVMGREEFFCKQYDGFYDKSFTARRKVASHSMRPKPIMETLCVTALLIVISIKLVRGVDSEYFIPTLSVFALAVIRILPSGSRISANLNNIMFGKSSVDAIYEDLKHIDELMEADLKQQDDNINLTFENEIQIKDLSFQYENNDKKIFNHISMSIKKNTSIALVGASGAGKTTLADIILGILQYEEGQILVDGTDIKEHMHAWQRKIGYIPQNIYITDDTIRRNVAFALEDKDIDDEKIWSALKEAQLSEFVEGLENGLDTVIGERGARISGGQRQRIGIARALYNNPEVLVLDEATSALDSETEKDVMESIEALNGRKTMIIIAHRLTTIENCDFIYRIEDGKAVLEKQKQ